MVTFSKNMFVVIPVVPDKLESLDSQNLRKKSLPNSAPGLCCCTQMGSYGQVHRLLGPHDDNYLLRTYCARAEYHLQFSPSQMRGMYREGEVLSRHKQASGMFTWPLRRACESPTP